MNTLPFKQELDPVPSSRNLYKCGDFIIRAQGYSLKSHEYAQQEFEILRDIGVNIITDQWVIGNGPMGPQVFQIVPYLKGIKPFHRDYDEWIKDYWAIPKDFMFEANIYYCGLIEYYLCKIKEKGYLIRELDLYHQIAYKSDAIKGKKFIFLDISPGLEEASIHNILVALARLKSSMSTIERYYMDMTNNYIKLTNARQRANEVLDFIYSFE